MTEIQLKKIFEKYNPVTNIVRCPNGRAKMRKPLDKYAMAAVNLYGIIRREEFVEIFNAQCEEQTTVDEVYTILLPNVIKSRWYGFYKDYIVHYAILHNFEWVEYLEREQADKPRYVPPKDQFLKHEFEEYEDSNYWQNVIDYMFDVFKNYKNIFDGYEEIKHYITHSIGIKELGTIMEKYNLVCNDEKQFQEFLKLLVLAKNNTRSWENKGYTPEEMMKLMASKRPKEPIVNEHKKTGPNEKCPCGSGKKYKHCCKLIGSSGSAQLSFSECKLFYETWYKLLNYVNKKHSVVNMKIEPIYPSFKDETLLYKIREKLWANPRIINEFLICTNRLSDEEIRLLQSWEKHHVKGTFLLVKYEPQHAVLMRMDKGKESKLYAVKGMTTSLAEAMQRQLPVMLETVLLPFGEKIVYDSFMASHAIDFGSGIQDIFREEYAKSMDRYGIMEKL